jgi:hypothetical protein
MPGFLPPSLATRPSDSEVQICGIYYLQIQFIENVNNLCINYSTKEV